MKSLFGPLSKDYCIWFYFLSVLAFVGGLFFAIPAIYKGINAKKDASYYLAVLAIVGMYLVSYFQNRLLYSMCSGSMK